MEDLTKRRLRAEALGKLGPESAPLTILRAGSGHVVFSSVDLTTGLLGANTVGILGYEPAYAQALVRNLIFWTLDGQPEGAAAAPPR